MAEWYLGHDARLQDVDELAEGPAVLEVVPEVARVLVAGDLLDESDGLPRERMISLIERSKVPT